jgi:chromosome partitioning protein
LLKFQVAVNVLGMIITVASFKGGVGKSTTAVHLAGIFSSFGPTILVDGDPNRSVTGWAKRGSLPFPVVDERQLGKAAREAENLIIDTQARPSREDLDALASGCDLLVIPTTPDALALDALMLTVDALRQVGNARFRILLTMVPPKPSRDGEDARTMITEAGLPIFQGSIRRLAAFQKAALLGTMVSSPKISRSVEAWEDYRAIGTEIMAETWIEPDPSWQEE